MPARVREPETGRDRQHQLRPGQRVPGLPLRRAPGPRVRPPRCGQRRQDQGQGVRLPGHPLRPATYW